MSPINRDDLARLTEKYGGAWGINHTRRLLHLISIIGAGQTYDEEVVWIAAHLHDWGAYTPWAQDGVDHAVRSTQVAQTFLTEQGCAEDFSQSVLDCIATHHSGTPDRRLEAILLSDADALDFLGVVGILRDFSKQSKNLRKAYETVKARRARLPDLLRLPRSQSVAAGRLREMDEFLAAFEADSFGCF